MRQQVYTVQTKKSLFLVKSLAAYFLLFLDEFSPYIWCCIDNQCNFIHLYCVYIIVNVLFFPVIFCYSRSNAHPECKPLNPFGKAQETFEASSSVFPPDTPEWFQTPQPAIFIKRAQTHTSLHLNKWRAASIVSVTRDFDLTLHYSAADREIRISTVITVSKLLSSLDYYHHQFDLFFCLCVLKAKQIRVSFRGVIERLSQIVLSIM